LYARRYRAALLDYLLGSDEDGLVRAYDLGRKAIADGLGLLEILRAHQRALSAIVEPTHTAGEIFKRLQASWEFLTEVLSPFEMTNRGYVALLEGRAEPDKRRRGANTSRRTPAA